MVMLSSLALTDALLCVVASGLAARSSLSVGYRMAFTFLAIPALLGFLKFSGIYPLETWHPLFTIFSACNECFKTRIIGGSSKAICDNFPLYCYVAGVNDFRFG